MNKTRCAVIGVGYLGKFHALKYAMLDDAELVAVADIAAPVARSVASGCNCLAVTDYRDLLGKVDAVSIAVPTSLHFPIARHFLSHGTHVLVEKPLATTVAEAEQLNQIARDNNLILQAGHLERFNAALLELDNQPVEPQFIESHRLAPFPHRSMDINVVLDLMIHDIDIILTMVDAPVRSLSAKGAQVLSDSVDIANARIEFTNGCVANITASRVSQKSERKMRIFQKNAYISLDFLEKRLSIRRLGSEEIYPGVPALTNEETCFADSDTLLIEIQAFLDAVRTGSPAPVSGEDGQRALETALRITELLQPAMQVVR